MALSPATVKQPLGEGTQVQWLKRVASFLPTSLQYELKRHYYAWQIRTGRFRSPEPEFDCLDQWIQEGDWVIDVGANVGHYTVRFSQLVGPSGRVLAFEPILQTFSFLAANVRRLPHNNVTLFNTALTDRSRLVGMCVPKTLAGTYLAHMSESNADLFVLSHTLDNLSLPHAIKLVKIDAEGHELAVLRGMTRILLNDRPTLIVEANSNTTVEFLRSYGYEIETLAGSPNRIFRPSRSCLLAGAGQKPY